VTHNSALLPSPAARRLATVGDVSEQFTAADYVCSKETATAVFLMVQLQRPLLVEGPPGVGKTELAKVLAHTTEAQLIRLQCYEGLDETKALYEWEYSKQLLYVHAQRATGHAPGHRNFSQ
jgi:MoxR-like ATPase